MHSAQNLGLSHADGHASESSIQLVEQVALLSAPFRDDRALRSTIDECLDGVAVHFGVNVKHRDVSEELRIVLHGCLVVSLDHLLADLFLNHLLRLDVVWVGVAKLHLALLLRFLAGHHLFHAFSDDLLDLVDVVCLEGLAKLTVAVLKPGAKVWVRRKHLHQFLNLLPHAHILSIVDHLIEQLLLCEAGLLWLRPCLIREECLHQVLVGSVQQCDVHVHHVIVLDADFR